jgi:hypothetical protein
MIPDFRPVRKLASVGARNGEADEDGRWRMERENGNKAESGKVETRKWANIQHSTLNIQGRRKRQGTEAQNKGISFTTDFRDDTDQKILNP